MAGPLLVDGTGLIADTCSLARAPRIGACRQVRRWVATGGKGVGPIALPERTSNAPSLAEMGVPYKQSAAWQGHALERAERYGTPQANPVAAGPLQARCAALESLERRMASAYPRPGGVETRSNSTLATAGGGSGGRPSCDSGGPHRFRLLRADK